MIQGENQSQPERTKGGILVIDDDVSVHDLAKHYLAGLEYEISCVENPRVGLDLAASDRPDLILLDLNMPEIHGFEVCRRLMDNPQTRDSAVVFLTSQDDPRAISKGLELGAADYLTKPFHAIELKARVRAVLRTKRLMDLLRDETLVDALTGLHNRRCFDESLGAALAVQERTGVPFSLLFLDLDRFKQINDTHGHGIGDDVLRSVGAMMRCTVRPYDVACRFGGDEFAVIANNTDAEGAKLLGQRLLNEISGIRVQADEAFVEIQSSIGIACSEDIEPVPNADQLGTMADRALYRSKRDGRGRISAFDPSLDGVTS
jgi:two-component system, cell cycle response regulator